MVRKLRAFIEGIREVKLDWTASFDDSREQEWYERGRKLAARFVRRGILR